MLDVARSRLNMAFLFKREQTDIKQNQIDARIKKLCAAKDTTKNIEPDNQTWVDTRSNARFVPHDRETFITAVSGEQRKAWIINISSKSVAIEADFSNIDAASVVKVGTRRVKPGRTILAGRVFFFEKPLKETICKPDIIL